MLTPPGRVAGWFLFHRAAPPRPVRPRLTPTLRRHADGCRLSGRPGGGPRPGSRTDRVRVCARPRQQGWRRRSRHGRPAGRRTDRRTGECVRRGRVWVSPHHTPNTSSNSRTSGPRRSTARRSGRSWRSAAGLARPSPGRRSRQPGDGGQQGFRCQVLNHESRRARGRGGGEAMQRAGSLTPSRSGTPLAAGV